ncbi:uncharacterized protein LOC136028452 [Artemia franciscana]|uniref:uncharacterized protein LOC136028452 n=1 Tax=Artemia franciscana TaxID=6661 RepID=UPI0032DBDAFE
MYTWYCNDGKTKKMLDYLIVRRCWLSSVQIYRLYRGAELNNTNHGLVSARIKLRLRANKSKSSSSRKIDTYRRKQDSLVCERYMVEVSNRFEALQQCSESDSAWNTFKVDVLTTATEVVGLKWRIKKEWIGNKTFEVIEQRRRERLRGDMTLQTAQQTK